MGKRNSYNIDSKDSYADLIYKYGVLFDKIVKLKKEVRKLKSENKTLKDAWYKTEDYLVAISENKTIDDVFKEIDTKTNIRKVHKKCPNSKCNNDNLNKRVFEKYYVLSCSKCGYRNRVNEKKTSKS